MSRIRASSLNDLLPVASPDRQHESFLQGLSANVKLLLKLIQEHNEACRRDESTRVSQRIAGMISIIDDIKGRIEKSIPPGKKAAVLRRCNTELRRTPVTKDRKTHEHDSDDSHALRRELAANREARKSLERMFSSLGKEKEIMAAELSRKVQEISSLEEDMSDLRAQNERLLHKVQQCGAEHTEQKMEARESSGNQALQERNKALSEQLLKSLDAYRSLKRKLKEAQEENAKLRTKMAEVGQEVVVGQERIHGFRERVERREEKEPNMEEELGAVETLSQRLEAKVTMGGALRSECMKPKSDVIAR
ncbi:hypothetical protein H6P81_019576 [Aristolochia fimbriata]|uniref:Uncharacterized protein n=1 Tax=Aristolochia fimbriata TaxID=158543 RepID=A0AAV7DV22_ARIFI|nr:hypothetical protein H6P81_019576 [Aristolochia fimbriata]